MNDKVIPDHDHYNMSHRYIWDVLGHVLTEADFEAIEKVLIDRKEDHRAIEATERMLVPFGDESSKMRQPRFMPDFMKDEAHKYVDWSSACDIWMILSKYAQFYSK